METFSLTGFIYKISYIFRRHYLFGWTLTRWVILALLIPPVLVLLKGLPWGWPGLAAVSVVSLSLFIVIWLSKQRGYVYFKAAENYAVQSTPSAPLSFSDKIAIRASGNFRVGGARRYFVEEAAFYQTFATQERVVMVNIPFTRFMLLSHSPEPEIGWWYSFFTPQNLLNYQVGTLYFGSTLRPTLQLTYRPDNAKDTEVLYLSFDTPDQLAQVLADLRTDTA